MLEFSRKQLALVLLLFSSSIMLAACGPGDGSATNASPSANAAEKRTAYAQNPVAPLRQIPVSPPAMGWATWNGHGCNINENIIKSSADYIVSSGLKAAGYQYVDVDDCWSAPSRDAQGNLQANSSTFPNGMQSLGNYIHSKGLKFGMYAAPGAQTCAGRTGSLGHESQDANTFAAWGVDLLKYDWCQSSGTLSDQVSTFQLMQNSLISAGNSYGKHIIFSINPNSDHPDKTGRSYYWGNVSDMWRTTEDISYATGSFTPDFGRVINNNFEGSVFPDAQHTGGYNDLDMMVAGMGMSPDNDKAHVSLWAISGAPLILGNDFTNGLSAATLSLLTNPEMIAIDQDGLGLQGVLVDRVGPGMEVWSKLLMGVGKRAVVLFNNSSSAAPMTVTLQELGLVSSAPTLVHDVWAKQDIGTFTSQYTAPMVPAGGVVMLTFSGVDTVATTYQPTSLAGGASYTGCSACANGKMVSGLGTVGFSNIASAVSGGFVQIQYVNSGATAAMATMSVNGGAPTNVVFPPSGTDGVPGAITIYALLQPGTNNSLTLSGPGNSSPAPQIVSVATVAGPVPLGSDLYEAEATANSISGGAKIQSCTGCSGGMSVGYIGNNSGTLTFNGISAPSTGDYLVRIAYANGDSSQRSAQVNVNGGAPVTLNFAPSGNWSTVATLTFAAHLNAGSGNTVFISNPSGWSPDIDGIVSITPATMQYEAEASVNGFNGGAKAQSCTQCSGGIDVGWIGGSGTLTFNGISVPVSGNYVVQFDYLNGDSNPRAALVSVNGQPPVSLNLAPTGGSWSNPNVMTQSIAVSLNAGSSNTLTISNPNGWAPDIDGIVYLVRQ
ncbi:carbohydrate-binding protein (plasmid) [Burkholderia sp. JSH-S8]|nr:carbohydrate-binding protein [Burkholderia sp. JSH-S8]